MRNNTGGSRRPKWLNAYRVFTTLALMALVVMGVVALNKLSAVSDRSFAPITAKQASKVETAATLLETVGFSDPTYLGVTSGGESEYPTFRVTAIGGKTIDVWIRTTRNGGLEIQPVGIWDVISSADDLTNLAAKAVSDWENIPPSIKPRTDGKYGEYEGRKYAYDQLAKYKPSTSYLNTPLNESRDWPRK